MYSANSINLLVCVMETELVFGEVENDFLVI
jgi:hypothetical protein